MRPVSRWRLTSAVPPLSTYCAAILVSMLAGADAVATAAPVPVAPPPPPPSAPASDRSAPGVARDAGAYERDAALVSALLALFNPWTTTDLRLRTLDDSALTDPRAASAIAFLLGDPQRQIRAAAAQALGHFPDNAAVEAALIRTGSDRQEPTEVRVAAVQALARVGTGKAGDALVALTQDDDQDLAVRAAAHAALETRFPAVAARGAATEVVDRRGRLLLIGGSALLGSYALGAVGGLGENAAGTTIGILGGALVGAGTAFFLTRSGPITHAQAGWMVSAGIWGAGIGMWSAGIATADPSTRLTLSFGLLGEGAALAAAVATRKSIALTGGDVAFIDLAGLTAVDLAGGALLLSDGGNVQLGRAALAAGALVGLGSGALLARRMEFRHADIALAFETGYEGLATGFFAGKALDATARRAGGAALIGMGGGVVGGLWLSQVTDYHAGDVGFVFAAGSYGKLLGVSIPMLADAGDPGLATGTLIGSVAAVGAAHLLRQQVDFRAGSVPFVGLATLLGLWHGLALGLADDNLTARQQTGASIFGAAAGGLVAMPLVQMIAPTAGQTLALGGGAFWGTWFAAWSVALANTDHPKGLRLTLAASDAGLGVAALLVSPLGKIDSRRIGVANLGGLAGAGLASLGAALATKNNDAVITANLIGSGVGLLGGALLAASLDFAPVASGVPVVAATSRGGIVDHLWTSLATPQLVPMLWPDDSTRPAGRPRATTIGVGLAFVEAREPAAAHGQ